MKFIVTVEETLSREIEVEAEGKAQALDKVMELHRDEEIVLGADDFVETIFYVKEKESN